jgi:nicotinate-nucleotide adenylyltransferase
MRIGIFGGTFNPIHLGHLAAAEEIRGLFRLDKVLFIPSCRPPHKTGWIPSGRRRLAMVRLALAGREHFEASDLEIRRGGHSYSIDTLRALRRIYGREAQLYFLMGWDALREIRTWRQAGLLPRYAVFIVFSRPEFPLSDPVPFLPPAWAPVVPMPRSGRIRKFVIGGQKRLFLVRYKALPISASRIRRRLAEGRSVKNLVPEAVERYIYSNRLYQKGEKRRGNGVIRERGGKTGR